MTGGPQARTIRTRERILDAAIELFLENGFHGTNIDSVASQSRSSKQTIYKYYNDKKEILNHAVLRLKEEFSHARPKLGELGATLEAELARFGLYYLKTIIAERRIRTFRLCVEMARERSELATSLGKSDSGSLKDVLTQYITLLAANGRLSLGEDPDFIAQTFLDMVRGNHRLLKAIDEDYMPTQHELEMHVERVTRFFCAALKNPT